MLYQSNGIAEYGLLSKKKYGLQYVVCSLAPGASQTFVALYAIPIDWYTN